MKSIPLVKRRDFIKGSLAMGSLLFLPKNILAQGASPNGKVNLALVGTGQQGGINLKQMVTLPSVHLVALCDADMAMQAHAANAAPSLPPGLPFFQRHTGMLEKMGKQIDAVFIATPDHSHFHLAMAMIAAGKHVMVEKPLTQTVAEARQLRDAAREAKVVTQMGNHGHAGDGWRLLKEWWEAGILGPVRRIVIAKATPPTDKRQTFTTAAAPSGQTLPASLDWNLYLGPRPEFPYSRDIHPGVWRRWWHFGSGMMGDFGCHFMDIAWRALDLGTPESVTAESRGATPFTFPTGNRISFRFPARGPHPPVELLWMDGNMIDMPLLAELGHGDKAAVEEGQIALVIGEKATFAHNMLASYVRIVPESLYKQLRPKLPPKSVPRIKGTIMTDWLAGIRDGTIPCSNFEISGPLTEVVQLGNVAVRAGGTIRWDPEKLTTGNGDADRFIHPPPPRPGWTVS